MSTLAFGRYRPPRSVRRHFLLMLLAGISIGGLVGVALYVTKATYVALLPLGLALILPALLVRDFRTYWFALFLLSIQFKISKNLNDGFAIVDKLKIDYTIWDFTFDVTATDLVLLVLLAIWANDVLFGRRAVRFPAVTWLAVGYLAICLASTLGAASPYLGLVELSRQIRFFIVYLFAVNCLDSKKALRAIVIIGLVILVTQAAMTILRFETGYLTPLTFGNTDQQLSQIEQYLAVNRSDEGSAIRSFGTLGSPGSTVRLCIMVIPFALFLCVPNPILKRRLAAMGITAFGLLGLALTFDRVFYLTTALQLVLAFSFMLRRRLVTRGEALAAVSVAILALAVAGPALYKQFTVREDSVSVRFLQYEAAGRMIAAHPIIGVGLNNGTGQKPKYANITYNRFDPNSQFYLEPTHNLYLSMASEIGIPGTLLFLAFFSRTTFLAWQQSRHSADAEIRLVASALVVVFCGVAFNSSMDPLAEYSALLLLWLYAGVTLNLPRIERAEALASAPEFRR